MARLLIISGQAESFTSPSLLRQNRWFRRGTGSFGKDVFPVLFRIIEKVAEVS